MKRCPTCDKTFDDAMRFCQTDGTPLVEDAPVDPYKTMVASADEIAAALNPPAGTPPAVASDEEIEAFKVVEEEEVLQLPAESDPNKTMFVSEDEIRREMQAADASAEPVMEIPPIADPVAPAPPRFNDPAVEPPKFPEAPKPAAPPAPEPPKPSFTSTTPSSGKSGELPPDPFMHTTPPIPSPFGEEPNPFTAPRSGRLNPPSEPKPAAPPMASDPKPPPAPFPPLQSKHSAPEPVRPQSPPASPFVQGAGAPPSPFVEQPGSNRPMNAAPTAMPAGNAAAGAKQNQTLAIISLVLGIAGVVFCGGLTSPFAIITGFMARGKAKKDPANYGGSGLALGGILLGVFGLLILLGMIAYFILVFGFLATNGNF